MERDQPSRKATARLPISEVSPPVFAKATAQRAENQPSSNGYGLAGTEDTDATDVPYIFNFSAASVTSAVNNLKTFRTFHLGQKHFMA